MLVLGLDVPLWMIGIPAISYLLYYLGTRNHDYFKKRGIPGPPTLPFLGTIHLLVTKYDVYNMHSELKKKYGKTFGMFTASTPEWVIFDEEMMSQITVKQFQNFGDRRPQTVGNPAFDSMLTALNGDHWKSVRSQMSPAFTTGKLRAMEPEINRAGKTFLNKLTSMGTFEARELVGRYTMDVIASSAFGLRANAQDKDDNEFVRNATKMTSFDVRSLKFLLFFLMPGLLPYFEKIGISLLDMKATEFFISIVDQTFKGRVDTKDKSHMDFLQLMVKAQQGHDITDKDEKSQENVSHKGMSKDEILANALLFFFAGFDTTAAGLSCLMYLLATNPETQQKLTDELDAILGDEEDIGHDSTNKMHYLDQCIQETLRIFPPAPFLDRVCKADTDVCGVKIEKGSIVNIPVMAIHKDPEIWPEPEKFDPDRFSPENKPNISPFHWMPFGYGPRNCIGMRLALFEIKVAIASLLKSHRLVTTEKTQIPLKMSKSQIMKPENGMWLAIEKR